ncbi:MAG: RNA polymerase sigma factor [Candidatus Gastranaerophilaceae bacterium]
MKQIIDRYKNNIKTIIKNLTGNPNEDLEQEVYIKTWKNLDKYKERGKFRQWISTVTSNICKDYLKSSQTKITKISSPIEDNINLISQKDNTENIFEIKQRRIKVSNAILSLKPKFREVIVMYEIDGLSYEEIGQKLNCPTGTIKSRIFKARQELSEKLKNLLE